MKYQCPNCRGFNTELKTDGLNCNECHYPLNIPFLINSIGIYFKTRNGFIHYIEKF
jgi:hypothetical protein